MNGAAQEETRLGHRHVQPAHPERIQHHHHRGQAGDADGRHQRVALILGRLRHGGGNGHGGRNATDARPSARQQPQHGRQAQRTRHQHAEGHGQNHGTRQAQDAPEPQRRDISHDDAGAQQRHPDAHQLLGRELDARHATHVFRQEMEGDADQQRVEELRAAVVLGHEAGGHGNDRGQHDAGQVPAHDGERRGRIGAGRHGNERMREQESATPASYPAPPEQRPTEKAPDSRQRTSRGNQGMRPPGPAPGRYGQRTADQALCSAVTAMALTMSGVSAPRDRSLAGRRRPCSRGPTTMAPPMRSVIL